MKVEIQKETVEVFTWACPNCGKEMLDKKDLTKCDIVSCYVCRQIFRTKKVEV